MSLGYVILCFIFTFFLQWTITYGLDTIPKFVTHQCYSCSWNTYSMDGDVIDVVLPGEVATITIQSLCADPFRKKRKTLNGDYVKFVGFLPVVECPTSMCQKINVKTPDKGNFVVRRCLPRGAACQKDKVIQGVNETHTVNCCDGHMCNGAVKYHSAFWMFLSTGVMMLAARLT